MVSIQTAPQIRLVQSSDTMMVEKIQSTIVNTIPLWKSQMVLALGVTHAEQAARAQREVSDMTNELLRKNAEVLKTATIESAKESERGIIDMETLKNTNANPTTPTTARAIITLRLRLLMRIRLLRYLRYSNSSSGVLFSNISPLFP